MSLKPEEPDYLEALGNEYERRQELIEAINMFECLSVLQPDRTDLFVRLGDIYKKKKFLRKPHSVTGRLSPSNPPTPMSAEAFWKPIPFSAVRKKRN